MEKLLLASVLLLIPVITFAQKTETLFSPDKKISVVFRVSEGYAEYKVNREKQQLVNYSRLGFRFKTQNALDGNFEISGVERDSLNEKWIPLWGINSLAVNHYNQMKIKLYQKNSADRKLEILFRAYNDGIAFRYNIPEQPNLSVIDITSEETYFNFAGNFTAWWQPMDFDSYEFLYTKTPISKMPNVNLPVTIKADNDVHMAVYQAALENYSDLKLLKNKTPEYSFKAGLVPWPDSIMVKGTTPFITPWRVIQIAPDAGKLTESRLIENLNEPCKIKETNWIKPFKYIGVWWGMQTGKYTWEAGPKHGATTENAKRYIDFAANHGINAVLYEGWNKGWETWKDGVKNVQSFTEAYPDFNISEIVKYGKERNVEMIAHNETGGNIPDYERQIDSAYSYYKSLGIHALKTGYAGAMTPAGQYHHGQWMVEHYNRVAKKCAENQIMLDAHEPVNQSGLSRTYPNWFAQEGARGMEWNSGDQRNPPAHTATLPYTRLLIGPMDFTPGIFNLNYDPAGRRRVPATLANQLALFVVLYSPWQMASDMIENYENQPAFKFFEDVPVTYDTSFAVNGQVGEYITVARKKGNDWFVAGITNEKERKLVVPFSFLDKGKNYKATFYCDALNTDWENNPAAIQIDSCIINNSDVFTAALAKAGGFAISIVPYSGSDTKLSKVKSLNKLCAVKLAKFKLAKNYGLPVSVKNIAKGSDIKLLQPCSMKYGGGDAKTLIDGNLGSSDYMVNWIGFEKNDMDVLIDLKKIKSVNSIAVNFIQNIGSWIFVPESVEYMVSADGKVYLSVGKFEYHVQKDSENKLIKTFTQDIKNTKVRYIKVKAKNIGVCPEWHYGKGGPAWIFCDEIIVK